VGESMVLDLRPSDARWVSLGLSLAQVSALLTSGASLSSNASAAGTSSMGSSTRPVNGSSAAPLPPNTFPAGTGGPAAASDASASMAARAAMGSAMDVRRRPAVTCSRE
jgi:hypothetical protein